MSIETLNQYFKGIPGYTFDDRQNFPDPVLLAHGKSPYHADSGLIAAVNVSILMGMPLLLTGPPGCGKTELAYAVANEHKLDLDKVSVRSTTTVNDLFYDFDHLARFRDSQNEIYRPPERYLRFSEMGMAILKAGGPNATLISHPGNIYSQEQSFQGDENSNKAEPKFTAPKTFGDLLPEGSFPVVVPTMSIVLIDEIDKAPRDTPNDMLGWLESHSFYIKELGIDVSLSHRELEEDEEAGNSAEYKWPFFIFTSNSEKSLPEPFLRRCAFYDIQPPDDAKLREIIGLRFQNELKVSKNKIEKSALTTDAIGVLSKLKVSGTGISRPPGTAEFLAWFSFLINRYGLTLTNSISDNEELLENTLSTLLKTGDDVRAGRKALGLKAL